MFSIWIGGRPPAKERECMFANEARHGLTLIASQNWVGARRFIPLNTVVRPALLDARVRDLWEAFPDARYRSDALRLWYLMQKPSEVYADSDCVIRSLPGEITRPLFPSIHARMEGIAARVGGSMARQGAFPVMDDIRNASGQWLDVWAIVGAGDASFFDAWLSLWAGEYFRPGGIAEALSYGPFEVGVLPDSCYSHFNSKEDVMKSAPATPQPPGEVPALDDLQVRYSISTYLRQVEGDIDKLHRELNKSRLLGLKLQAQLDAKDKEIATLKAAMGERPMPAAVEKGPA
jgi:hypothetical protein